MAALRRLSNSLVERRLLADFGQSASRLFGQWMAPELLKDLLSSLIFRRTDLGFEQLARSITTSQ